MDGTEGNLQELLRMGGHDVGGSGCPLATPVNKTKNKQTNFKPPTILSSI